jgi:hypothetical protein
LKEEETMTSKEHFAKEHAHHTERAAHSLGHHEDHAGLAKFHHAMADRHPEDADLHKTAAAHHERLAANHKAAHERHVVHAAHFKAMADGTAKAGIPDDIEKARREQLEKTSVSRVTPTITPVLRHGSASLQAPNVPAEFAKTFAVEETEVDLYGKPLA